jgi:serine/threonine protein kinase
MTTKRGKNLGNFTVEEEIGRGGMGVVLLARQQNLERPAVLKKIRSDLSEFPELAERFKREARTAAAIHHQNVVAVYDCFSWRGDQYIAQEFVDGVDLSTALTRIGGALPWRIAALIALEVSRGLEEIHSFGTVHRDLKPANILLGRRGEVKIGDFGLALDATGSSLTQPGVMIGSPPYMPPEQMLGQRVDARCDLFSMGVMLYEMLAGQLPFPEPKDDETDSLLARMQRERYERVRKRAPGTPRFLASLVRVCLRAKPAKRAASAAALRRRLEERLGKPSPADVRSELTSWLWERGVFELKENETVLRVIEPRLEEERALSWIPGALACGLVIASLLLVDIGPSPPEPVPDLSQLASAQDAMDPNWCPAGTVLAPAAPPAEQDADGASDTPEAASDKERGEASEASYACIPR